ncbi:MAG TPA: ABC transporter substrate-binding protein [Caldimonas sp.]
MNKRRKVLSFVAAIVASRSLRAQAPARIWRVSWLSPADGPGPNHEAFLQQMRKLGYDEGRNLHMEWVWVGAQTSQLPRFAAELVQGKPDVLVSQSQVCALALQRATTTIPIVFVGVRDPVLAGLVSSMAHPGGNLTGFTLTPNADLVKKHLELLSEIVPRASRLAVFWNPDVPVQAQVVETIKATAQQRGFSVQPFEVHRPGDIEKAFETLSRERPDGILTLVEWFTYGQRFALANLAIENGMPTFFEVKDYVVAGGLLSYGVVYHEHFALAATYVDKIIKGAKPAELPVQQPAKFEMVINLKSAKAMKLKIPQSVLVRADEIIE